MISEKVDSDADGNIDKATYYTIDSSGNITKESEDQDNDGVIDSSYVYTFDSENKMLTEKYDGNNNGIFTDADDYSKTFTYDNLGREIKDEQDDNSDSTIEEIVTTDYTANTITTIFDDTIDNSNDLKVIITIDEHGNATKEEYDSENDGTVEDTYIHTNTYNTQNKLVKIETNLDGDAAIECSTEFTYDAAHGNITCEIFNDYDFSSTDKEIYTWEKIEIK